MVRVASRSCFVMVPLVGRVGLGREYEGVFLYHHGYSVGWFITCLSWITRFFLAYNEPGHGNKIGSLSSTAT